MARIFHETEHQELFYRLTDLREPLNLHIPSALGPLAYYVCLRVDPKLIPALDNVETHAKLEGLRNTDFHAKQGDKAPEIRTFPSTDGKVWYVLCRMPMARGDGVFTFFNVPANVPKTDVLFCTWLRYLENGDADAWLAGQSDPAWAPSGVPLGGIGTGRVDICRDGRFRNFSGNNNQDVPYEETDGLDGAYLSIRVGDDERLLSTRPIGTKKPCPQLEFKSSFPRAILSATEVHPGLDVSVVLSGPLTPQDLKKSSMPVAMLRWTLKNTTNSSTVEPIKATCRFAWPNLVGVGGGLGEPEQRTGYGDGYYRYWESEKSPSAHAFSIGEIHGLNYSNAPSTVAKSADGHHLLAVRAIGGITDVIAHSTRGSVGGTVVLAPGETMTIEMALVWKMPHWIDSLGVDRGMHWQNYFPDAKAMILFLFNDFDGMLAGAAALESLLKSTHLPEWMWRRLCNSCYPLVTNSVLYPDGRFSINEGPTEMSGVYGTIDQRLGSHAATQLLFPELNKTELLLFSRIQDSEGGINHDLGSGHLERGPHGQNWPDIACSYTIQMARHAWTTGDAAFAHDAWPRVKFALERHGKWADQGGGVAQLGHKTGLGTSYDSYHYEGTTAYIATLWIAGLLIGKKWAKQEADEDFIVRADQWITAAVSKLEGDLWNGRYYRAYASVGGPSNENCHGGMLAGEWYARLLADSDVLSSARLATCAAASMEYQGNDRFPVPPDEVAPDGTTGSLYGWLPYIESFCIAPAAVLKHPKALVVWERMIKCMQGNEKHPCDTRLMYRPQTGEQSWGAYYMTAPASWLVYEALIDFSFDPAHGILRINPMLTGSFAIVHPLFWGKAERVGNKTTLRVTKTFGDSIPTVRAIQSSNGTGLKVDGGISSKETGSVYTTYTLTTPTKLSSGTELTWENE